MLDLIRKKQKTTLIKFVFWAIIATFVGTIFLVWGKGNDRGSADGNSVAMTVNDTTITIQAFQSTYRNLYQFYQNLNNGQFNDDMAKRLGLAQTAYDQLVRQALLEQEGDRLGIEVTRQELVDSIAKIPQFQKDGLFDRQTYLQLLEYQRLTPDEFESSQERVLFAGKVEDQIQSTVTVTDSDIEAEYRKQNEKINLNFVRLAPTLFESKVKVDDASLKKFFQDNQEDFRIPVKIAIRYLQFEPGRYVDEIEPTEADLEKYYKRNLDKFEIAEQASASHILIKLEEDMDEATKAEKRKLAESVLEKAKSGEDFAALARKFSDDTGTANKGGTLGYFPRGSMVPAFETAAFSLEPGEISNIVESQFGLHIIKGDGYIKPAIKPMAEVLDEVTTGVKKQLSNQYAFEKAMDAYNINRKTGDLDKAAKDNNLGIKESGLFDRNTPIDGINPDAEVKAAAFALEMNELAHPIRLASGIFLVGLKEKRESQIPEFSEVKKQVEDAYRKEKSVGLADAAAAEMLAALKDGQSFSSLAKKAGVKIEETGLFASSYGDFIPQLGNAEDLAKDAFSLTKENKVAPAVYELADRFVVVMLKDKQEADLTKLDSTTKEKLRETVKKNMQREVLDARIEELKKAAIIVPTPYFQSLLDRG